MRFKLVPEGDGLTDGWYYPAGTDTDNDVPDHAHAIEFHMYPED